MRTLLILVLLFNLRVSSSAQVPPYVSIDSLLGWWPFNNNSVDESVNTNDGMPFGPLITTNLLLTSNSAYLFDGYNDGITMPALDITGHNEMSISVWVNPSTLSSHTYHEIIRQDNGYTGSPDFLLSFQNYGSILSFGVGTTVSYSELDIYIVPATWLNTWTHIVAVYDGINRIIYKNGVTIGSGPKTGFVTLTSSNFTVGCEPTYTQSHEFFSGKIDDIGIWRRALRPEEVLHLYYGGLGAGTLSVQDNQYENSIQAYPNPANDILNIQIDSEQTDVTYQVADAMGQIILNGTLTEKKTSINTSGMAPGIYFVTIGNEVPRTLKIIKN
jgi:Concanavalin A-like lectin/glucanases superfamily/Secretion system C-terminal sorting domain